MYHRAKRQLDQVVGHKVWGCLLLLAPLLLLVPISIDLGSASTASTASLPASHTSHTLPAAPLQLGIAVADSAGLVGSPPAPTSLGAAQAITGPVSDVDVALVFDRSASMDDDIYCYRDNSQSPCYVQDENKYPEGRRLYLPYADWICEPSVPISYDGYEILVSEAEYFSHTTSYSEHPYDRDRYTYPNTFWMLQRVADSQASGYRDEKDDRRGAHLMHMPHASYIPGHESVDLDAPRLDYAFDIPDTAPVTGTWYVWIRAQCGAYSGNTTRADSCTVHWGVDGTWREGESTDYGDFGHRSATETGSDGNRWTWARLGAVVFPDRAVHQVNIWGGGSGFRLDKVLLTRNPQPPDSNTGKYPDRAPAFIRNTTGLWDDAMRNAEYQTYEHDSRYGGPPDTKGHTGYACHKCNPIYGLAVNLGCAVGQPPGPGCEDLNGSGQIDADEICDNRFDDIFDDAQPVRAAKEAAKRFAQRLNARYQQLALVSYSTQAVIDRELNCIQQRGYPPAAYGPGVWDPDTGPDDAWTWCYDHRSDPGGYSGTPVTNTADGSILYAIEGAQANGWTSLAGGLSAGLVVLSAEGEHYGRPCAVSTIVLISDGVPNRWPTYNQCGAGSCCEQDLYLPNDGSNDENRAKDCAIYYADQARRDSVIIYAIGLGLQADHTLLQAIADRTAGQYYYAPGTGDLDAILQDIADRSRALAPCLKMNDDIAPASAKPGEPVTFTLMLTNTGDVDLHATITQTLPAHVTPTGILTWTATITTPGGVWAQAIPVTVEPDYFGSLTSDVEVTTRECFTHIQRIELQVAAQRTYLPLIVHGSR